MSPTFRCQTCVKAGREIAAEPKLRQERPRGATAPKLQCVSKLHDSPKQRSHSKKRKSSDEEVLPVKISPQRKENRNVDDKTEEKTPKDKPTSQTKTNNNTDADEKMEAEHNNNSKKVLLTCDEIHVTKEYKDTL